MNALVCLHQEKNNGTGGVKDRKWKKKKQSRHHTTFTFIGSTSRVISRSYIIISSAASLAALALRRSSACCLSSATSFVFFTLKKLSTANPTTNAALPKDLEASPDPPRHLLPVPSQDLETHL